MWSTLVTALLGGLWKPIAQLLAGIGLYAKGRRDANVLDRARDAEQDAAVRERQLDAAMDRPRSRDDLVRRMRDRRGF